MDLFEYVREKNLEKEAPLASRLRPTTLEEVVGQQHIIGKDKLLYRAIKADKLSSISFLPATVALICLKSALVVCAITLASVVLPVPGGP